MNTQELHELAKKVAPLIGYEYIERFNFNEGKLNQWAKIECPQPGVGALYVEPSQEKGKIAIAVAWPRAGADLGWQNFTVSAYRLNDRKSSIRVSEAKTPEQIAKEIKRRLWPDAESLYQEAYKDMVNAGDYQNARRNAIIGIAEVLGKTPGHDVRENDLKGHFYFNNVEGEVTVSSATCIKVEYTAKNVEQARKIIEFLKTLPEAK